MEQHYKLYRVRELADNDQDFINALALTFLEEVPEDLQILKKAVATKDYNTTYQMAHKLKPTVDLFELGVLDDLILVQDWGKFEQTDKDITPVFEKVVTAIDSAISEIQTDFAIS
ncbi:Hpt domain-containing protein [Formosa sediminum]|uniref:Hpt domain-containing protein n=1 Tax=Formosa sediminum TaxID=2594004 RepID=A0A516GRF4_9FLAO|nr:Hpt domain-containing protein [Formosa sediminum]QDO94083.1 Hpt domain-containing protein [Formosa sediminum]